MPHGAPESPASHDIVGVLLCAGRGRRFGGDKLQAVLPDGQAVATASLRHLQEGGCRRVVAVLRPDQTELAALLAAQGAQTVVADRADLGMGHSLAAAVRAAGPAGGWVVALADMPMIQPASIATLIDLLTAGADIAVLTLDGRRGHPVGWSAVWHEVLVNLEGDQGARDWLRRSADRITTRAVQDRGIVFDIDTAEAMAALRQSWPAVPRVLPDH